MPSEMVGWISVWYTMVAFTTVQGRFSFTVTPEDVYVAENASLWWHCHARATNNDAVLYEWLLPDGTSVTTAANNDTTVSAPTRITVFRNGTLYLPRVGGASEAVGGVGEGEYVCVASSVAGVLESPGVMLRIAVMDEHFQENPKSGTSLVDDVITLHCSISSQPPARVTWFLNDVSLVSNNDDVIITTETSVSMATVTKNFVAMVTSLRMRVDYHLAGLFWCRAENYVLAKTVESQQAELVVQGRPYFVVPPAPRLTSRGSNATFHCQALSNPAPSVAWFTDMGGQQTQIQNSTKFSVALGTLTVHDVRSEDERFYTCRAENAYGSNTVTVLLTVQENSEPARITYLSRDQGVSRGHDVTLRCRTDGRPAPVIRWLKDGSELADDDQYLSHGGDLVIRDVGEQQEGRYTCEASNVLATVSKHVRVLIHESPMFRIRPSDVSVKTWDPLVIDCAADGKPEPEISWTLPNGVQLASPDRARLLNNGSLYVDRARPGDSGTYTCRATNSAGTVAAIATVTVLVPPQISSGHVRLRVVARSSVRLPCHVTGSPVPTIVWSRATSGSAVSAGGAYTFAGNGSLMVSEVRGRHAGVYRCTATNPAGTAHNDVTLTVLEPPMIIVRPGVHDVILGRDDVSMPCTVRGTPEVKVTWSRRGRHLVLGENMSLSGDNILTIRSVRAGQLGGYVCTAKNEVGQTTATGYIYKKDLPVFLVRPTNVSAAVRQPVVLGCQATARQSPWYQWFSGLPPGALDSLPSSAIVMTSGSLHFPNVTLASEGWYTCVVTNPSGQVNHSAFVDVQVPPSIVGTNSPQTVEVGGQGRLTCQAEGDPDPLITWSRPGENNDPAGVGDVMVVERSEMLRDWGDWTCSACNAVSCVTSTVTLYVTGAPVIVESVLTPDGPSLTISCPTIGLPKPRIDYLLNQTLLVNDSVHTVTREGLKVSKAREEDVYGCLATNLYGNDHREIKVPRLPGAAVDVVVENVTHEAADVAWRCPDDGGSDVTRVAIRYSTDDVSSVTEIGPGESSTTLEDLSPYHEYRVSVRCASGVGYGPDSRQVIFQTLDGVPPAPLQPELTPGKFSVLVTWSLPDDPNGDPENVETVIRLSDSVGREETLTVTTAESQEVRFQNLSRTELYAVNVWTRNGDMQSEEVKLEIYLNNTAPAESPADIRVMNRTTSTLFLAWEPLSPVYSVTYYVVRVVRPLYRNKRTTRLVRSDREGVLIGGLQGGGLYGVQVAAGNYWGQGAFSARVTVATKPAVIAATGMSTGILATLIVCSVLLALLLLFLVKVILCCRHKFRRATLKFKDKSLEIFKRNEQSGESNWEYETHNSRLVRLFTNGSSGFYDFTNPSYRHSPYILSSKLQPRDKLDLAWQKPQTFDPRHVALLSQQPLNAKLLKPSDVRPRDVFSDDVTSDVTTTEQRKMPTLSAGNDVIMVQKTSGGGEGPTLVTFKGRTEETMKDEEVVRPSPRRVNTSVLEECVFRPPKPDPNRNQLTNTSRLHKPLSRPPIALPNIHQMDTARPQRDLLLNPRRLDYPPSIFLKDTKIGSERTSPRLERQNDRSYTKRTPPLPPMRTTPLLREYRPKNETLTPPDILATTSYGRASGHHFGRDQNLKTDENKPKDYRGRLAIDPKLSGDVFIVPMSQSPKKRAPRNYVKSPRKRHTNRVRPPPIEAVMF